MKMTLNLLRLTLLTALTLVRTNAQTVEQVIIFKGTEFVQTSASGAVVDPKGQGPSYGGPFNFRVSVQGIGLSGIAAPVITLAPGSTWPTDNPVHHNGGTLVYNSGNDEWAYGINANNYGGPTLLGRDTSFAFGDYDMLVTGTSFTLHFPEATTYPVNTPSVTLSGGSWVAGKYVIDVSQPLTITGNAFPNFNQNADAAMELQVEDNFDLFGFYSDIIPPPNPQTYTIPGGTLTAGRDYQGRVSFYGIMDRPVVGGLPGALIGAVYAMETKFTISTISTPVPGAQGVFYRMGNLGDSNNGGHNYSEVRDVTKTGGVIYAVGNSIAYAGSQFSDTGFLWTSTNGMTALPNIVDTFQTNPPFVTASAITPDAAYIAGRVRADSGGGHRHATRTATSGLTNLDLGYLGANSQHSAATAISNDGSIMYGFGLTSGRLQAARFTASGPTITAIPFLNGGDNTSSPAPRGTSADGSVMVGTSSNTTINTNNPDHVGNQAFRYVEGSGVSAIPFLTGGTWSGALALSADGNLALISGDSTAHSGGEVYLYNNSGATTTSLGAPTGQTIPSNVGGMNSDGSLVVLSWGNSPDGCYLRNGSGWHSLTTIMAHAGIDLTNWSIDNTFGMSPDGTLIWGVGTHNGVSEGWVAEFNAGYLAGFGAQHSDFNADGKSDVLLTNTVTGDRAIWLMNGTSISAGAVFGTLSTNWTFSGIGDFNGDGKSDIVLTNISTGERAIWLMNGTSIAAGASLGILPTAWAISGTGDFNGDGKSDILLTNTVTGDRAIWLMNGTSISAGAVFGILSTNWTFSGIGDFNGDGKADILLTNTSTGERAIWQMNGTSIAAGASLGILPTDWAISGTGDFNSNGKSDILLTNTVTGDRAIWLMNGTSIAAGALLGTLPTSWVFSEVGDFNGDGKADIFLTNTATGERAIWLMNGTSIAAGASLGVLPTNWQIKN